MKKVKVTDTTSSTAADWQKVKFEEPFTLGADFGRADLNEAFNKIEAAIRELKGKN